MHFGSVFCAILVAALAQSRYCFLVATLPNTRYCFLAIVFSSFVAVCPLFENCFFILSVVALFL